MNPSQLRQKSWNFQVETLCHWIRRTNLSDKEKGFLCAIVALSFEPGQSQDGQTFVGPVKQIGQHPYLRRGINTAREIKKELVRKGLIAPADRPGCSDTYCINWDPLTDLPTLEEDVGKPPASKLGPLQFIEGTPPVFGGHPSNSGGVTPPVLEPTPPISGGVPLQRLEGSHAKPSGNQGGTPPEIGGVLNDMSLSLSSKDKRQRHVTGWWPSEISARDLHNKSTVQQLWLLVIQNGWYAPTDKNRRIIFAHAHRCLKAKNPGGAFTFNLMRRSAFYRPEDMVWADTAIAALDRREEFSGVEAAQRKLEAHEAKAQLERWMAARGVTAESSN